MIFFHMYSGVWTQCFHGKHFANWTTALAFSDYNFFGGRGFRNRVSLCGPGGQENPHAHQGKLYDLAP